MFRIIWNWFMGYLNGSEFIIEHAFLWWNNLFALSGGIYITCFLVLVFSFIFYYVYLLRTKRRIFKYLPFGIIVIIYILLLLFAVIWSIKYHSYYLGFMLDEIVDPSKLYFYMFYITVYNMMFLLGMFSSIILYKLTQIFLTIIRKLRKR